MAQHPGSAWLDRNWAELQPFNNKWVAATAQRLVASSESLTDAASQVREQKLPLEAVIFAYVTFNIVQ